MDKTVKNTEFDNLVNYRTEKSSADFSQNQYYNTVDPTSLAYLLKNNQIVEYRLVNISENEITNNEVAEPNNLYETL